MSCDVYKHLYTTKAMQKNITLNTGIPYLVCFYASVQKYTVLKNEDIYAALEKRRTELGLSQAQVSIMAFGKADNSAFQSIRRGASPSVQKLEALAQALGLEFKFGGIANKNRNVDQVTIDGDAFAAIPRYSAEASAGAGADNGNAEVVETLAFRQDWLTQLGVKPGRACLLKVRGDSMEPTLRQGDLTLIDETRTRDFAGQVFALVDIDGMTRVKRLDLIDQATLALRSDNPDYQVELRRGQEMNRIKILGQVVWSGHAWI